MIEQSIPIHEEDWGIPAWKFYKKHPELKGSGNKLELTPEEKRKNDSQLVRDWKRTTDYYNKNEDNKKRYHRRKNRK